MNSTVRKLYEYLNQHEEVRSDFRSWKNEFTAIHGLLDTQRKLDVGGICKEYQIDCSEEEKIFELIFCLETYYTIVLRCLAYTSVFKGEIRSIEVFDASYFQEHGVQNYFCNPYFNWFIGIPDIIESLHSIATQYEHHLKDPETDFIKAIFENIFPSAVKHAMGEFYTPDWLANFVIETITENDDIAHEKTYLDPTCGSGTFIFNVIRQFQKQSNNRIFQQVYGIDLNPVSVLAAKTNYLILYAQQHEFSSDTPLQIPIYYADAIQTKFNVSNNLFSEKKTNDFEDITIPLVDYIVGNPPWVNWEYLPKEYRLNTAHLWHHYNLFNVKGLEAAFIKEDISVLVTYVVLDKYLKENGKLGFVVKETLFKSIKQGEGFRKFKIYPTNTSINPYRVDDLTLFKPFKEAVNKTALLFIEKGQPLNYPVDYIVWKPNNGKRSFENNMQTAELGRFFEFQYKKAQPCDSKKLNSGWVTVDIEDLKKTNAVLGNSAYTGRTGLFTGGSNAVFWLNILKGSTKDNLRITNITERAKNKVDIVEANIEPHFIFPFITGNELDFWEYKYTKYLVCPHTAETKMYPVGLNILKDYPQTLAYFERFKPDLQARKGFTSFDKHIHLQNYYALQRIGDYTFAPYKVAWRFICKEFRPAVIEYAKDELLGNKNIIPNEKIIFVGLNDRQEAFYLCGVLSSTVYRNTIHSYMVDTQITPSILSRLNLPKFDSSDQNHVKISNFCEKGHFSNNKDFFVKEIDLIVDEMVGAIINKAMLSLL
jgi:methylase of polypeptide subunit release factors